MTTVGIRDLARRASAIVRGVRETGGAAAIVTDRGRPVGVLYPIDAGWLWRTSLAQRARVRHQHVARR